MCNTQRMAHSQAQPSQPSSSPSSLVVSTLARPASSLYSGSSATLWLKNKNSGSSNRVVDPVVPEKKGHLNRDYNVKDTLGYEESNEDLGDPSELCRYKIKSWCPRSDCNFNHLNVQSSEGRAVLMAGKKSLNLPQEEEAPKFSKPCQPSQQPAKLSRWLLDQKSWVLDIHIIFISFFIFSCTLLTESGKYR